MPPFEIQRQLEALLFVADGPTSVDELARALEADMETVEEGIQSLSQSLAGHALAIARVGNRVQMVTTPETSSAIERFLGMGRSTKLSSAALETLAIVAYRQPVTRARLESIRGVNSDGVLRTLLAEELVAAIGRLEQAGRPILYGTTFEFLQYFGIPSLAQLPHLPAFETDAEDGSSDGS